MPKKKHSSAFFKLIPKYTRTNTREIKKNPIQLHPIQLLFLLRFEVEELGFLLHWTGERFSTSAMDRFLAIARSAWDSLGS